MLENMKLQIAQGGGLESPLPGSLPARGSGWDILGMGRGRPGVYPGREGFPGNVVGPMIQGSPMGSISNALTGGTFPGQRPQPNMQQAMNQAGYDVMDMVTPGPGMGFAGQVDAFHGSPHSFNRFKNEAMGTGEGAQAFGWGHYFTDKKDIAQSYTHSNSRGVGLKIDDQLVENMERSPDSLLAISMDQKLPIEEAEKIWNSESRRIGELASFMRSYGDDYGDFLNGPLKELNDKLKKEGRISKDTGNLYKVQIHKGKDPSEYDYLDWDKGIPDKQANRIRENFIKELRPQITYEKANTFNGYRAVDKDGTIIGMGESKSDALAEAFETKTHNITNATNGQMLYHQLNRVFGSDKEASMFLLRSGIDGIRYPAGTLSGVKNSKAKNYVVFDPEAVTIEERMSY